MGRPRKYSEELRERAIRLYFESGRPIAHVAKDLGIGKEVLRRWVRQAEADRGLRPEQLTSEREELKRLRKENVDLKRAAGAFVFVGSGGESERPGAGTQQPGLR
jgi:transposase